MILNRLLQNKLQVAFVNENKLYMEIQDLLDMCKSKAFDKDYINAHLETIFIFSQLVMRSKIGVL